MFRFQFEVQSLREEILLLKKLKEFLDEEKEKFFSNDETFPRFDVLIERIHDDFQRFNRNLFDQIENRFRGQIDFLRENFNEIRRRNSAKLLQQLDEAKNLNRTLAERIETMVFLRRTEKNEFSIELKFFVSANREENFSTRTNPNFHREKSTNSTNENRNRSNQRTNRTFRHDESKFSIRIDAFSNRFPNSNNRTRYRENKQNENH